MLDVKEVVPGHSFTHAAVAPMAKKILASKSCGYTFFAWTNSANAALIIRYPRTATQRTPRRSEMRPQIGQATSATTSSAKPSVPTLQIKHPR